MQVQEASLKWKLTLLSSSLLYLGSHSLPLRSRLTSLLDALFKFPSAVSLCPLHCDSLSFGFALQALPAGCCSYLGMAIFRECFGHASHQAVDLGHSAAGANHPSPSWLHKCQCLHHRHNVWLILSNEKQSH